MVRSKELDNIKTALVIIMLLYHSASCLNIWPQYLEVLYFIHYAFILMTGAVVGFHYLQITDESIKKSKYRLIQRGIKLLCIFILCNSLFYLMKVYSLTTLMEYIQEVGIVQFLCNPKGRLCAFEILYYIAIFLIISPICLMKHGTEIGGILGCVLILLRWNPLVFCIGLGLLGICLGNVLYKTTIHWQVFLKAIIQWGWTDGLLLFILHMLGPWHQQGGVVFIEILLWLVFIMSIMHYAFLPKTFDIFGKYTLLAYIFQVLFLAILAIIIRRFHFPPSINYFILLVLATGGTLIFLHAVNRLRKKFPVCDGIYKFIFS